MFLFDQNISYRILKKIASAFPDCQHVTRIGLPIPPADKSIWQYAKSNNLAIVTFDEDFSDIANIEGFPPKIIWFRTGNLVTSEIATKLALHQAIIHHFLADTQNGVLEIY